MTLKEEIYQTVHDYLKERIQELSEADENDVNRIGCVQSRLIELLRVQRLIYQKFAEHNEKLAQEVKPVRINTNLDGPTHGY